MVQEPVQTATTTYYIWDPNQATYVPFAANQTLSSYVSQPSQDTNNVGFLDLQLGLLGDSFTIKTMKP